MWMWIDDSFSDFQYASIVIITVDVEKCLDDDYCSSMKMFLNRNENDDLLARMKSRIRLLIVCHHRLSIHIWTDIE
jgi:hypothetical protein